ncbi:MAG: SGNH/GDSL hydrolase family protein [Planctomycetota bacterium]|nr:SGNH/GDSL hydrolase family protein [Planctomycetota bacterium]
MMIVRILFVCHFLLALSGAAGEPQNELEPVKPELLRPRNGLGNIYAKLNDGKEVRIAYFGGSITAANGWRVKTLKWFQTTYPKAKASEIIAAIGGTGSDLGAFRCRQDVLQYKPDLVCVEFAVNDGGAPPQQIYRTMEGIVRQIWTADPATDICFVYTLHTSMKLDYEKERCPRSATAQERIADYYGIPSINVAMRIVQMAGEGKLVYKKEKDASGADKPVPDGVMLFSNDECHPTDPAHQVYCDVIVDGFKKMEATSKPGPHELKAPFVADNWENARLVPIKQEMLTGGWKKLDPQTGMGKGFQKYLPEIWEAKTPGDKLTFAFKGTAVKLYDIVGPDGGQAVCTLDGKASPPRPRFDMYCSYHRLASLSVAEGLANAVHTVTVEVHPEQPNRDSVLKVEKNKPGFKPEKYNGTVLRVGAIMLLGDLQE